MRDVSNSAHAREQACPSPCLKTALGAEVSVLLLAVNKHDTNQVVRPAVHFSPGTLRIVTGVGCVPTHSFSSTFSPRGNLLGRGTEFQSGTVLAVTVAQGGTGTAKRWPILRGFFGSIRLARSRAATLMSWRAAIDESESPLLTW